MAIVTVGIDLAKNVFAIHGVDEAGFFAKARAWRQIQARYLIQPALITAVRKVRWARLDLREE